MLIFRQMGHIPLRQHRYPKLTHQQWRRLRILQAQQHQHPRSEPLVQWQPRHQRRQSRPVRRRSRLREERLRLQRQHEQCL